MIRGILFGVLVAVIGMVISAAFIPLLFPHGDYERMGQAFGGTLGPLLVVLGFGLGYKGNHRVRATAICFVVMLILAFLGAVSRLPAAGPLIGPKWRPAPELLKQLGPESRIGDYRLRVPRNYERITVASRGDNQPRWAYKLREPKSAVGSTLVVTVVPRTAKSGDDRKGFLKGMHQAQGAQMSGFNASPVAEGQINGIPFLREQWTARAPALGETIQGVTYIGAEQFSMIAVVGITGSLDAKKQLPLIEAAARTVHPQ